MTDSTTSDSLAPIRVRFLEMLNLRKNEIQSDLECALEQPDQTRPALGRIEVMLHKIAGTAGTLGFVALGDQARKAEEGIRDALGQPTEPTQTVYFQIIDFLELCVDLADDDNTSD